MSTAIQHRYRPRGTAAELWSRRDDEVLLSGPAGTGKTRAALEKMYMTALLNPGMRGLIVRKTLASLGSTALVTWREHVAKEGLAAGVLYFYGGSPEEPAQYRFANGSVVVIGGMDKSTKIMSSEYDMIYAQEAIELTTTDWEALTTRLRNGKVSFQQLIGDANPDAPTHWLKARCDAGKTLMLNTAHEDNPVYFREDGTKTPQGAAYIAKLDNLSGVRYLRLRKGIWAAAEGVIYEEFSLNVHVVDLARLDHSPVYRHWRRFWVVDFGYTHPFVLQMWAEDPDGRLYLYREIFRTRRLVEDHAREALSLVTNKAGKWIEPQPEAIICDHDAEDRATLERYLGRSTVAATKTVSDGIQAVQSRLRVAGDGRPRLLFERHAAYARDPELIDAKRPASTIEEFPGYVWNTAKDAPIKEADDGMDCVRYMVAFRDIAVRPGLRFLGGR